MPAKGHEKVDIEKLKAFCRLKPTLEDCAAFFSVNVRTITRSVEKHTGLTFTQFRHQNMVHTRHSLVRKAIEMALAGNTAMMIFCLKNLCGWADQPVDSDPESETYETPESMKLDEKTSETD